MIVAIVSSWWWMFGANLLDQGPVIWLGCAGAG